MKTQYRRCWTYPDENGNVRVERSEGIPQLIKDVAEGLEWVEIDALTAAEKTIAEKEQRIKDLEGKIDRCLTYGISYGDLQNGEFEEPTPSYEDLKTANTQLEQQLKEANELVESAVKSWGDYAPNPQSNAAKTLGKMKAYLAKRKEV